MEELLKRYEELYSLMTSSKDPKKMLAFGDAERWAFKKVCEQNPKVAQFWLEKLKDPDRPEFIRAYFGV